MVTVLPPLTACQLTEVTTPRGQDVLVVESILRAGGGRQIVLLHRSLEGAVVPGETGATVSLSGPGGQTVLRQAQLSICADRLNGQAIDSLEVQATCYATTVRDPVAVQPGATYELSVATTDGRVVRGRTTVPGSFDLLAPQPARLGERRACSLPPRTNLPLVWSAARGAWSYLADLEILGLRSALRGTGIAAPDRLRLTGLAISEADTTLLLPGEFGIFESANVHPDLLKYLQQGFPAGVTLQLTVAAVDRNFVNSVRGGSFNPSGHVRISSVVGDGVGVFGSLVVQELQVVVGSGFSLPRCIP